MKIEECALKVIDLAALGNKAAKQKKAAFGMDDELGLEWGTDDSRALACDVNVGDERLREFLESLDIETLQRLHALMYSGRDPESAPDLKKHFGAEPKSEMIRAITEKRPALPTYFAKGLDRAKKESIDLDGF